MPYPKIKPRLERIYTHYNQRRWVHPDPLECLYNYPDWKDREIAGFIASALAYGRVAQILRSVTSVLQKMAPSPREFLESATTATIRQTFKNFKHRFTSDQELVWTLEGIQRVNSRYGSLYQCFLCGFEKQHEDVLPALSFLVRELRISSDDHFNSLLPSPSKGSACKRLNLFLRWMIRKDNVDPGGWKGIPPSKLLVPLDTHMHRICLLLRLTRRKQVGIRTAMEVTQAFRKIEPSDPVRYDFSLTRLGIRKELDPGLLFDAPVLSEHLCRP